jgi:hypothetical protein
MRILDGNLRQREAMLSDLRDLSRAVVASDAEVLGLIDRQTLFERGIGYIDAHLLAAVRLTLWPRDRRLQAVSVRFGLAAACSH